MVYGIYRTYIILSDSHKCASTQNIKLLSTTNCRDTGCKHLVKHDFTEIVDIDFDVACHAQLLRVVFEQHSRTVDDDIQLFLDTTADSYTNAENHLQIICIRSVVQAVADAVLAVCKERKLTDAKLYTSHWA